MTELLVKSSQDMRGAIVRFKNLLSEAIDIAVNATRAAAITQITLNEARTAFNAARTAFDEALDAYEIDCTTRDVALDAVRAAILSPITLATHDTALDRTLRAFDAAVNANAMKYTSI